MSIAAAITPLVKVGKADVLTALLLFWGGGCVSAVCLGVAVGWLGSVVGVKDGIMDSGIVVVSFVCLASGVRNERHSVWLGRRQTHPGWIQKYGRVSYFLWGADMGLAFTTQRVAGAPWIVMVVVLASKSAAVGALVMVSFWTGRTVVTVLAVVAQSWPAANGSELVAQRQSLWWRTFGAAALAAVALISVSAFAGTRLP